MTPPIPSCEVSVFRSQDFFGGISIFTREQFEKVNGYGVNFWGWGREDDNMRYRLLQHGMLPPEVPHVPRKHKRFYFDHQTHGKALEVRRSQVLCIFVYVYLHDRFVQTHASRCRTGWSSSCVAVWLTEAASLFVTWSAELGEIQLASLLHG